MRAEPYWQASAPRFAGAVNGPVEGEWDAAVVGAGFTGLSAALALARAGRRTIVLEAEHVGFGASGRNGGHVNNGLAHSYSAARERFGPAKAATLWRAFDASIDLIERIVADEGIDCVFRRAGKLKLASKPAHYDALARDFELVHREVDPDTALLSRDELAPEIGSRIFYGGLLQRRSAAMHMGRYAAGLAAAAARHGATVVEGAPVTAHRHDGGRHRLATPRGEVLARRVLLATGAYTGPAFPWARRRILPVGSFVVATRPLTADEIAATVPGRRNYVTTRSIVTYFRLAPDDRLIFGGRARFSGRADDGNPRSTAILRATLAETFPALAGVEIDYSWGGLVDMTRDRFPRVGVADGVHYAMGYSGSGAQLSTLMGTRVAEAMCGGPLDLPFADLDWPAIPAHFARSWTLPLVGLYYRALDRVR